MTREACGAGGPTTAPSAYPDYPVPDVATLGDIVARGEAVFGDAPAFRLPDGNLVSYRMLAEHVGLVAHELRERGVGPGDFVALPAMPSYLLAPALFACANLGGVAVLGDAAGASDELLAEAGASAGLFAGGPLVRCPEERPRLRAYCSPRAYCNPRVYRFQPSDFIFWTTNGKKRYTRLESAFCNPASCNHALQNPVSHEPVSHEPVSRPVSHNPASHNPATHGSVRNPATRGFAARRSLADLDAPCCVLASSGTSGAAKRVVLSQRNLVCDMRAGLARYSFARDARYVSVVPATHAFGLTCDLLAPLATGGVICEADAPQALLARLPGLAPTALNVPPQFAQMLLDLMRARVRAGLTASEAHGAVTGGALRKMLVGGAGMPARLADGLRAFGVAAFGCYGLSECAPCVSVNRDVLPAAKGGRGAWDSGVDHALAEGDGRDIGSGHAPGTSGETCGCTGRARPVPAEPPVFPANRDGSAGLPLGCNEVCVASDGEILVRGENVMLGYLGRPDLTERALRDGWLHTGDLGRLDPDGFLWVDGRKDNLIALSDGTLASPEAWERALCALPGVRQAFVYAREGHDGVELAARLWVPGESGAAGVAALRSVPADYRAERTGGEERMREVLAAARALSADDAHLLAHVEASAEPLPTTTLGKLRRSAL